MLDLGRVRRNATRVSRIAARNGVRLRPHIKTHKCVEIGRIAVEGHNGAITTSTLAEVHAFARHGFDDFTFAVPIEPGKFDDAIGIIKSGVKLNLITDDPGIPIILDRAAAKAGVKISLFLKIDCGYHRCGVEPGTREALEIPRAISGAPNLEFAGILTHAGHSYHARSTKEIAAIARHERDVMASLAAKLRSDSIEVPTVSIGSTPTISHIDQLNGIDEVRPGNYIFFDAFQATLGSCGFEDCALTVLTAVTHISRTLRSVVVDAGAIAISKDRGPVEFDPDCGYGRVLDLAGKDLSLRIDSLSQEHGVLRAEDDSLFDLLKVGTRLRILANHSCLTTAQHSHFNVFENGSLVDKWEIHRGW